MPLTTKLTQLWEVHIESSIPEILENIPAATREAALAIAVNFLICKMELKAFPMGEGPQNAGSTPKAKVKRKSK